MNLDEYKKYLSEIQLFECKTVDPFKEQTLVGNYVFGYFENIDQLQERALGSLPDLTKRKIEHNLKKLTQVRILFFNIDHSYADLLLQSENDFLTIDKLKIQLIPFELKCNGLKKIDGEFLNAFYDSFLYRLHSLLDLINNTEDYLAEKGLMNIIRKVEKSSSE